MKASHKRVIDFLCKGWRIWYPTGAQLAYIVAPDMDSSTKFVRVSTLHEMASLDLIESHLEGSNDFPDTHYILMGE